MQDLRPERRKPGTGPGVFTPPWHWALRAGYFSAEAGSSWSRGPPFATRRLKFIIGTCCFPALKTSRLTAARVLDSFPTRALLGSEAVRKCENASHKETWAYFVGHASFAWDPPHKTLWRLSKPRSPKIARESLIRNRFRGDVTPTHNN